MASKHENPKILSGFDGIGESQEPLIFETIHQTLPAVPREKKISNFLKV